MLKTFTSRFSNIARRSLQQRHFGGLTRIGSAAPAFSCEALVGDEFKTISLDDYKGQWLVLFFYPLDFTFVCPTEITQFNDRAGEFADLNTAVVGASIDSKFVHKAWANTPRSEGGLGAMSIPLLADVTKKVGTDYGAMLGDNGFTCRATYIIDPQQNLRHMSFNDPPVGRNVDEILRTLQGYQYSDTNPGMVCPVGWTPKKKAMSVAKSSEYFAEMN